MNIAVTGANGFVGRHLVTYLGMNKINTTAISRSTNEDNLNIKYQKTPSDITSPSQWDEITIDNDIIIHCLGRAHITRETEKNPLKTFETVNTKATIALAQSCIKNNVKKFIFLSSIGVYGKTGKRINENLKCEPIEDYAISKLKAEIELMEMFKGCDADLIILRPPLIYGNNAPGNLSKLTKIIKTLLPLPLGAINNERSFIFVGNLCDSIYAIINSNKRIKNIYNIADDNIVSTSDVIKTIAKKYRNYLILPVPIFLVKLIFKFINKEKFINKLADDLSLDIRKFKKDFNWKPQFNTLESIEKTC